MENLLTNEKRAKNAIILIWIVLAMEIVSIISGYLQYDLLTKIEYGLLIEDGVADSNDLREQIVGIVYLIVFIVSSVTFIMWFKKAYSNLHLKVKYLSYTEGWAIGCWFVPFLNLYRPYKIMDELYSETIKFLNSKGISFNQDITTKYISWWWGLWILSNYIGKFTFRYSMNAKTIDELITSTVFDIVLNIIGIPLALITVKVITDYANLEAILIETNEEEENNNITLNLNENNVDNTNQLETDM